MKLPRKPTKIERMWLTIKWIREWNWLGGTRIYVDPAPNAIHLWRKLKKDAEKRYRKYNRKNIRENRIGLKIAIQMILKA